jgi:glutamine amidotransferase
MQELAKSHANVPSVEELTYTLRELCPQISKHGTFNFLLSNGQALWAHASTKLHYVLRAHPFTEVHLKDEDLSVNLAKFNSPEDRLAIVVTEPLTTDEDWVAMAPGQLNVFMDGVTTACSCVCNAEKKTHIMAKGSHCQSDCAASSACKNICATSQPV